jgi:hypothetical protein
MFLAIKLYHQGPIHNRASGTCQTSIYESLILGKTYGIKVWWYLEHLENLMGTNWEHIGDNNENQKKIISPHVLAENFQDEN